MNLAIHRMATQLANQADPTYRHIRDALAEWEDLGIGRGYSAVIDGVTIGGMELAEALDVYIDAWSEAWVAEAACQGHVAVVTNDRSQADDHVGFLIGDDSDGQEAEVIAHEAAISSVWDGLTQISFANVWAQR